MKDIYTVKVGNVYLTVDKESMINNYLKDHYSPWRNAGYAIEFPSKLKAVLVASLVGGKVINMSKPIPYRVGKTYKTIGGDSLKIVDEHKNLRGYETVVVEYTDGRRGGRYNRSDGAWCNGRTTGSKWTKDCLVYPPQEVL